MKPKLLPAIFAASLIIGPAHSAEPVKVDSLLQSLLKVQDVTQIQTKGLSDDAKERIRQIVNEDGAELVGIENPTTTLEELFLDIVRESQAHPGRRAAGASAQSKN